MYHQHHLCWNHLLGPFTLQFKAITSILFYFVVVSAMRMPCSRGLSGVCLWPFCPPPLWARHLRTPMKHLLHQIIYSTLGQISHTIRIVWRPIFFQLPLEWNFDHNSCCRGFPVVLQKVLLACCEYCCFVSQELLYTYIVWYPFWWQKHKKR